MAEITIQEFIFMRDDELLYVLFESETDFYRNGRYRIGKAKTLIDYVCLITIG